MIALNPCRLLGVKGAIGRQGLAAAGGRAAQHVVVQHQAHQRVELADILAPDILPRGVYMIARFAVNQNLSERGLFEWPRSIIVLPEALRAGRPAQRGTLTRSPPNRPPRPGLRSP